MTNILLSRKSKLLEENTKKIVSSYIKKDDKVVILGFSFFEKEIDSNEKWQETYGKNSKYYNEMETIFINLGVKKENISWINYYDENIEQMKKTINESNILYLPGGAPDEMMERIHEKELTTDLENFKGLVIGSSAGAMIQFNYFHISKDNDYQAFNISDGLGYIHNFSIEVHFRRKKKQKSGIKKAVKLFNRDLYTLPDSGMIIVSEYGITLYDGAELYYQRGKKIGK
ncbi:predicted Peptidase S51 dipeptidase E [Alteracholeplasma palmae J233]|uniref:Predicted Peptidase S51 dipeptidase E n=1 Tax=Alteracholeplasma palmae (strain ATCC 49389 / J233) TaxID=1318466 RepID=U4KPV1_ALTPJ|nr:Type 1 glutamine amidotransferase-like domain-containing protein [Alteracholeplasma palmae]CCV64320.1 predicted Peptidase S51 dipeptidase E [Alteracholeplasma palmae J233]